MEQTEKRKLDSGDLFPRMEIRFTDGNYMTIPDMLKGSWTVLLVYRGGWWPHCRQQLADFQSRISDFDQIKIKVIGASADSLEDAQKSVERKRLTFPIAYGLDARAFAAMTGAFFDDVRAFIQATGFILRPDGKVDEAVYSTGRIGRFVPADTLSIIEYHIKKSF